MWAIAYVLEFVFRCASQRGPFIGVLTITGEYNMYANLILRSRINTTPKHSVLEQCLAIFTRFEI